MIFGIIFAYLVLGLVIGLLSKESEFDEGWRVLLWFVGWPVLGIIVNRREDVIESDEERIREAGEALAEGIKDGIRDVESMADECDGCMLQNLTGADENHILTCLKCRRSYVEGSDERKEYSDYYIAEEEEK